MDDDNRLKHVFSQIQSLEIVTAFMVITLCWIQQTKVLNDIASFTVVNRHLQLVAFGATLLSNERVE